MIIELVQLSARNNKAVQKRMTIGWSEVWVSASASVPFPALFPFPLFGAYNDVAIDTCDSTDLRLPKFANYQLCKDNAKTSQFNSGEKKTWEYETDLVKEKATEWKDH